MTHSTPEAQTEAMLKAKLGRLLRWRVPEIQRAVGPFAPEIFDQFDARRRELVDACQAKLAEYSRDQITTIDKKRPDDERGTAKDWKNFKYDEISKLQHNAPPWHAGGFGHPDYVADFEFWCKMPNLSVEETLCLSIGIGPQHFTARAIADLRTEPFDKLWETLRFLLLRHLQLRRKFDPAENGWKVQPTDFLAWSEQVDFESHPEFIRLLTEYHPRKDAGGRSVAGSAKPDKREIDKVAQLFTAMAMEYLGYNPNHKRNTAPKEIVDLAASMGLQVSDETVRKYLKRGAEFLPDDWEPRTTD